MDCEVKFSSSSENSSDSKKIETEIAEEDVEYVVVAPDGGYGWIVIGASFLCILISDGILFSFGLILSELERVFDEPVAKVAWIFSIVNGISLISGPIASALSNRFSFRAVVLTGSIFGFVGLSTSSLAQSVDILFFTLGILFGVSIGLIFTPLVVGVGYYFDKRRALATGITVCGSGAGTFVFAPVIYWLLEKYAIRGTFLILSGIYLNCAVLGSLLLPLKPQRRKILQPEGVKLLEANETPNAHKEEENNKQDLKALEQGQLNNKKVNVEKGNKKATKGKELSRREYLSSIFKFSLFRSPTFVVVCISSFFQSIGWFVPFVYLAAHAVNMGIPKEEASFLLSIVGICSMMGRIINGVLADHPKVSVLLLNNIGLSASGLLIILCPFFISYELLVFYSIVLGLALSCTAVTRPILLGELLGLENVNNAYGFMLVFYGVATLFGTPMAGLLYDTLGDYHGAFYLAGSCVLLSAFICYPLGVINRWEKRRNSKK
ncbi:monocarboxylate transporter 12-like isoform X1 [Daphnia pulicaria]|uniref:monocarboxylate transporter 12-like isoform X1 n=1 Tax=Daphnia pulicaria TaxID=35523 RepID=UPI001EEAABD0|nr:monocarboxylate transporter 12-like isoform X1 [Daphnia pulicaria]XP_046649915.1 monocarboxylate transporter 12-like isoform X1 [Daphnia pulicaria]XP_046649916.1 monocarboxylate transporter 12-like isoform X1 [Daphnia pulicaria]XP_046649917.1 monocarboxylate transporter 12-like isoform X1 [Daphnia pulicaria]